MTLNCGDMGDHAVCRSCRVAVIGAGAAGLVAARELLREGHSVAVYEHGNQVGGVWVYDPEVDEDPLGLDPHRQSVHSSMYASLRTNLPRELMGYLDFPFLPRKGRDERMFPGYQEVALYLQDFAREFDLFQFVRFSTRVEYVGLFSQDCKAEADVVSIQNLLDGFQIDDDNWEEETRGREIRWVVRTRQQKLQLENAEDASHLPARCKDEVREEVFDAVVICNGHFFQPRVAEIPGVENWPGKQLHSHNYRTPEPFKDQVIVVIGNGASGVDISLELTSVAKEVHFCARKWDSPERLSQRLHEGKLHHHPLVEFASEDSTVHFQDGSSCLADVILHCTGYLYSIPFLDTCGIVTVESNAVGPLYKHVFPPLLAPSLSFVGLPFKVFPFPTFELQSRWIARALSKSLSLPSVKDMMVAVQSFEAHLAAEGIPKHYTHCLDSCQSEYNNWLAAECQSNPIESWRIRMLQVTWENRRLFPESFRDVWNDDDLLDEAQAYLLKLEMGKHHK